MCDDCRKKEFALLALALTDALPPNPDPDDTLDPIQAATLFVAAASMGQVEMLAMLSATMPLDEQHAVMMVLNSWSEQLGRLRDNIGQAIGHRIVETGETPPAGMQVLDSLDGLPPEIVEKLRRDGSAMVSDAELAPRPIPADDNPELLARIFREAKPRRGRGRGDSGPVS